MKAKTHAQRRVGLDPDTAGLLRAHWAMAVEFGLAAGNPPQLTDLVFQREPGTDKPLPTDPITQAWRRLCREGWGCGADARPASLQASMLLDAGEAVTVVAGRLGHCDASTTPKNVQPPEARRPERRRSSALQLRRPAGESATE